MKARRLAWALSHRHWTVADWRRVLWTDESSMAISGPHRQWVTRRTDEEYGARTVQVKFRHATSSMIWGSISGLGTGPMFVWDPKWGRITAATYQEHTIPVIDAYLREHPELIFMHDLAPAHNAKSTKADLTSRHIILLTWPANSPDLNPIEGLWQRIKEEIYKANPRLRGTEELNNFLYRVWSKQAHETICKLIDSMPQRIEAVIAAQGGHTKW